MIPHSFFEKSGPICLALRYFQTVRWCIFTVCFISQLLPCAFYDAAEDCLWADVHHVDADNGWRDSERERERGRGLCV